MSRLYTVSGLRKVRNSRSRKGQVTIFMIIGIVLLFGSAIIFYIRGQVTEGTEGVFAPIIEEVPLEAQPLKIFVENCLKKIGRQAVEQIGLHGGYVDPSNEELSGTSFLISLEPTESDALAMFDGDKALLPYWWYMESDNECTSNCRFESNTPSLTKGVEPSIEGQIDRYIDMHIKGCFNEFRDFRMQGFEIVELKELASDAKIAKNEVLFFLDYPIEVTKNGRKTKIERFFTKVNVDLKRVYDLAQALIEHETETHYLELHTMNLISMYSKPVGRDRIPPIAHVSMGLGEFNIWTRLETKKKIESSVLAPGIPIMQVDGTLNYKHRMTFFTNADGNLQLDAISQGIMDSTTLILNTTEDYSDLAVDFTYLDWWPIYLNINDAEVVGPTSLQGSDLLSFLSINQYRTWYGISFPVLITIRDYSAFEGEGYEFRYAIETNIRENNYTTAKYVSKATDANSKLSCKMDQRNTGNITIETRDAFTGEPVPARVDYVLGNQACFIGFTEHDANQSNRTFLTAPFPVGWGLIRVNNDSYLLHQDRMITRLGEDDEVTVDLMPFMFINSTVFAKGLSWDKTRGTYVLPRGAVESTLSRGKEKAFLMFKRVPDEILSDYKIHLPIFGSNESVPLKIVPGKYQVKGLLIYDSNLSPIRVPKESIEVGGFMGFGKETVEFNQSIINPYLKGGVTFNDETGYLEFTTEQLLNTDKIVFYVLRFPPPSTHSEALKNRPGLEQMGTVTKYSMIYRSALEPMLISFEDS